MQIGIMGGTFDPIHVGHLLIAEEARIQGHLDEIWFIPTHLPPHKSISPRVATHHRWNMVCTALEGNPYFVPVDIELKKNGVSYTIETVETLIQQYPERQFHFILGADMYVDLPKWYRYADLIQRIRFIVFRRPGYELQIHSEFKHIPERFTFLDMPTVGISSSEIRKSIANRTCNPYWLPDAVYDYIKEHHLYES